MLRKIKRKIRRLYLSYLSHRRWKNTLRELDEHREEQRRWVTYMINLPRAERCRRLVTITDEALEIEDEELRDYTLDMLKMIERIGLTVDKLRIENGEHINAYIHKI